MKYTYHFHAIWCPDIGQTNHIDGLITFPLRIESDDDYKSIKDGLAENIKIKPEELTICSLTLLHSEEE